MDGKEAGTSDASFTGSKGGRKAARVGQRPPEALLKDETGTAGFKSFTYKIKSLPSTL